MIHNISRVLGKEYLKGTRVCKHVFNSWYDTGLTPGYRIVTRDVFKHGTCVDDTLVYVSTARTTARDKYGGGRAYTPLSEETRERWT